MAGVSRELTLVDKFSAMWNKFISKAEESEKAVEKVEKSIQMAGTFTNEATGETYQWTAAIQDAAAKTDKLGDASEKAGKKGKKALDGLEAKLAKFFTKFGILFVLIKKLASTIKGSMSQVPDQIMKPFNKLKTFFTNTLARAVTSFFKGLNPAIEKTNQLLESPAAQNFVKGLQVVFEALGRIAGFVLEQITKLFKDIGEGLEAAGIDVEDLAAFIGGVIGTLYVTIYNIIVALYNAFSNLIWSLKKLFSGDFKPAIFGLLKTIADFVLDVANVIAKALDKIFGWEVSAKLMEWKSTVDAWAAEQGGWAESEGPKQLESITYEDYVDKFAAEGRKFGQRLKNLGDEQLNDIKDTSAQTASNTKAIKDVLTDEDFKMLIDVATQKFVSNVNLTAQTPVINITGQNTGNTAADRRALANDIKYILMEQLASGSTTGEYAYAGV